MYSLYIPGSAMACWTIATAYPRKTQEGESARLDCVPKMAEFLRANNLREDIRFCHKEGSREFTPIGCNWEINNNPPYIVFEKSLIISEPEGTRFFLKKACYQIKGNHKVFFRTILTITLLFFTVMATTGDHYSTDGLYLGPKIIHYKTIFLAGSILGLLLIVLNSVFNDTSDSNSNRFAIKQSTTSELQGALKLIDLNSQLATLIRDELNKRGLG